jgi:hypothetical protein
MSRKRTGTGERKIKGWWRQGMTEEIQKKERLLMKE